MMPRTLHAAATVLLLAGLAACQSRDAGQVLPRPDESITFFGPGRERLDWRVLPPISFSAGSWRLLGRAEDAPFAEAAALSKVVAELAAGRRILVIGVGDAEVPAEHGRQQALARALAVRRALLDWGPDPSLVQVTGFAADEMAGIPGSGGTGPRVEFAVIR